MTWGWNVYEKLLLNNWNWLVTTIFEFAEVIKIQFLSVFTDHNKIFIPPQIWKLLWLVCTLKYTKSPIKIMKSTILSVSGDFSVNLISSRCGSRYFSIKEVSWQRVNQSLAVLYKKVFSKFEIWKYFNKKN